MDVYTNIHVRTRNTQQGKAYDVWHLIENYQKWKEAGIVTQNKRKKKKNWNTHKNDKDDGIGRIFGQL